MILGAAKGALLKTISAMTRRSAALLPPEAGDEFRTLPLSTRYRVEGPRLDIDIHFEGRGWLRAVLLGYETYYPTKRLWTSGPARYEGRTLLSFDLSTGQLRSGAMLWGTIPPATVGRRFCWRLELTSDDGRTFERMTGHYRAASTAEASSDYFQGSNYVDYESDSAAGRRDAVALIEAHPFEGTALEIGCATGALLLELQRLGIPAMGVDFSEWAVEQARGRVGADRVFVADVERQGLPEPIVREAPFGAIVLHAVLEHFGDPLSVLERLTALTRPGSRIFITTTNADSLCHRLFGPDWEGYFDGTHRGVDRVSVEVLRQWLTKLGWRIERLDTTLIWDGSADPDHATLRDWWGADARFRALVAEKDLGDLLTCVATRP